MIIATLSCVFICIALNKWSKLILITDNFDQGNTISYGWSLPKGPVYIIIATGNKPDQWPL